MRLLWIFWKDIESDIISVFGNIYIYILEGHLGLLEYTSISVLASSFKERTSKTVEISNNIFEFMYALLNQRGEDECVEISSETQVSQEVLTENLDMELEGDRDEEGMEESWMPSNGGKSRHIPELLKPSLSSKRSSMRATPQKT